MPLNILLFPIFINLSDNVVLIARDKVVVLLSTFKFLVLLLLTVKFSITADAKLALDNPLVNCC